MFKNAPLNTFFNGSKEAEEHVKLQAKERGYAIIKDRAKYRVKGQKDTIRKKRIICDRFGKLKIRVVSGDRKRQNRGTIKTECMMQYMVI